MRARRSLFAMVSFGATLCLCAAAFAVRASAQAGSVSPDLSSFLGSWTLNRELTGNTPSPDVPGRRGGRRGGGFGIGGGGGGGFGGRGGRGRGQNPQAPSDPRVEGERRAALMQELVTPTTRWLIAMDVGQAIAFTNADGRTVRYTPNNKAEKHQLTNGTIETKTRWDRGELRQDIAEADGIQISRTFAIDADRQQLTMTITLDGNRGGQDRPFHAVYDRDEH